MPSGKHNGIFNIIITLMDNKNGKSTPYAIQAVKNEEE